ncbi:hypothetical protein QMT40_002983 [Parvibaculaceae bacterium PLY_AMNH_Bact1]|nr:hypothetical protein QMT40_002983 [Parvibaculaceae bacterium PLY_AMNH_Bact1]
MSKGLKFVMRDPKKDHIVQWPVQWKMPNADGDMEEVGFTAHFKVLPSVEVEEIFGGGMFGRFTNNAKNREGMAKVLLNWSGVLDHDQKAETPFSEERLASILSFEDTLNACVNAYAHCLQGHHEKN